MGLRNIMFQTYKCKSLESCENFLAGKQWRMSFKILDNRTRRNQIMDLVHSDVCSTSKNSFGSAQYFVTFINNHSYRHIW